MCLILDHPGRTDGSRTLNTGCGIRGAVAEDTIAPYSGLALAPG